MISTQTLDEEEHSSDVHSEIQKNIVIHYLITKRTVKTHGHLMKKLLSFVKSQLFITLLPTDTSF